MKKIITFITLILIGGIVLSQGIYRGDKSKLAAANAFKEINNLPSGSKTIVDSMHWDGPHFDAIGTNAPDTFGFYAFFPAIYLSAHNALGNEITSVKLYINGVTDVDSAEVFIYSDQGITVLCNEPFVPVEGWNNVVLTNPLAIPATDLYIGYNVIVTGGHPGGCDAGPVNANGNWMIYKGDWYHLNDLNAVLTYNWNIRAMVDGTAITTPVSVCTPLSWDAGQVGLSSSKISGTFTLINVGASTLTCSGITGLSAPFTTNLVPASVNLAGGASKTFTFTFAPVTAGTVNRTAVINTNGGSISIDLTGTGVVCNAINTYPFAEGFESGVPPVCWISVDGDGDGFNWEQSTNFSAYSGTATAASASYDNATMSALTPDNYLITPKLNINNSLLKLKYRVAPQDPKWPAEHYSVMVSTSGVSPAYFTEIFSETLIAADSVWKENTLSLAAYNGQNIYIAFRHHLSSGNFFIKIDDVLVDVIAGLDETSENNVSVYPNPAKHNLYISAKDVKVTEIYNIRGSKIKSFGNLNNIDISDLSDGIYMVRVITKNKVFTEKINICR